MAQNVIKGKGTVRRGRPSGPDSNPQLVPLFGIVKDNIDPNREGRIWVYLNNNSGLDPDNSRNWRPVKFLSPFYGLTRGDAATDNDGNYKNNPSSYGMWMSQPDIGTTVLCLFVNGDLNYGFYIGCVPDPESMQMLPAIGATDNIIPNKGEANSYGNALRLPVTNINKNNKSIADTAEYLKAPKPVHSYVAATMFQQGILRDPIRGPISSSSQRETPSRVGWGISTPGRPIYEGGFDDRTIAQNLEKSKEKQLRIVSRRAGHSIVMDDGDIIGKDNLIRIRTADGHQILMSDDGQTLMILHKNGQSYIELGKEGTVDVYSTNSVNIRTQGDLNLHADRDVNIHAGKNLNLQGENIHLTSEKEYKQRVGSDYSNFTLGKHTTKVNGAMSMESGGDISMASSALAYVNGSKVLLNSGQTSTKPAQVPAIVKTLHTDTLFDNQKGFLAAPAKLTSITSRAPAHAPWANAGQGVDVKTDLSSSSQLPASPSGAVADTNAAAASAGVPNPVRNATAASAPAAGAASQALSQNATKAIVGQVATSAANGPLSDAITKGTAIANTAQGTVVGVGQFAQTPQQLEQAGVLKPGAASLVTSIAAATGNVQAAMTDNLFTGTPGAEKLSSLVQNIGAQTESVIKNIQVGQIQLQNAGVITGAEAGQQVGGMIMSTVNNGLPNTLGGIKGSVSQLGGGIAGALAAGGAEGPAISLSSAAGGIRGSVNSVMRDISAGNFAAGLGDMAGGALAGLQSSVDSLAKSPNLDGVINQTLGVAASAFDAISKSIKPLEAGKPQNLTALAQKAAENTISSSVASASSSLNQATASLSSLAKNAGPALPGGFGTPINNTVLSSIGVGNVAAPLLPNTGSIADSLVSAANMTSLSGSLNSNATSAISGFSNSESLIKNPASLTSSLQSAASTKAGGLLTSIASSLASGLSNLPGAQNAAGKLTNLKNPTGSLPGTDKLTSSLQNKATELLNNIGSTELGKIGDAIPKGDLLSSIPKGLPAGSAAELQNALGAIASAGSGIKMPSIAVNTTDRSSIDAAVVSQLDDPGIPGPNFGEVDEQAGNAVKDIERSNQEKQRKLADIAVELSKLRSKNNKAQKTYDKLKKKLPQGDPAIQAAFKEWEARYKEVEAKQAEFEKLYNQTDTSLGTFLERVV